MTYANWIEFIFGSSLAAKNNPDAAALASSPLPVEVVRLVTRIFTNCGNDLAQFDDVHVAEGLRFIAAAGESDWMYLIFDTSVPWGDRLACIRSMHYVYSDCFARRCSNPVIGEAASEPIGVVCFMWWDVFPSCSLNETSDEERARVDRELISVMSGALELAHDACRESALHGLGHWEGADPPRVHEIVDSWLVRNPGLPKALVEYAQVARDGQVQ